MIKKILILFLFITVLFSFSATQEVSALESPLAEVFFSEDIENWGTVIHLFFYDEMGYRNIILKEGDHIKSLNRHSFKYSGRRDNRENFNMIFFSRNKYHIERYELEELMERGSKLEVIKWGIENSLFPIIIDSFRLESSK